ncbi:bifunctional metallophosphatase/5'-nucleotidase [Aeribacillus alveayuensis]|uniref:2',3'-cyclic-nucleotide 2'-phosphodiesterase (5'-nucleotidase family) n=1 Tax=Aeribacillus alveayuensis TaxID=279215 RepID=A0ABT9VM57_9BACI|nr:2',3'-cyclic-nucleotide 2'-phosphodiesterase (5'-nucleotidase family) [Bacillus alveayuensis]
MLHKIHVYHTNDLHSHFENWPKIAHYLKERQIIHEQNGEEFLLFDIGDHVDRSQPLSEATAGKANVSLLNQLNYHAVTIGNNEGITLSYKALNELYENAHFPIIVSNLYDANGMRPKWAKPYLIINCSNGFKIGLLGVTVYYEKFYEMLGWKIVSPFESIKEVLQAIRNEADIIILLSHLGITDDEWVAEQFPEIHLILGGHTHHVLPTGKYVRNSLLAGAGKYGQWIGHVELSIDVSERKLIHIKAELMDIKQLTKEDEQTQRWLERNVDKAKKHLEKKVAELKEPLEVHWFSDSPFAKLLASAIQEWCDGELAMVNAGVLLESLPKGPVTKGDIHRICPHPINPCKVMLKGDQLKEVILQARTKKMEQLQLKGLGFRGKVMGRMIFSGAEVIAKTLNDGAEHVQQININGKPLDPNRMYAVATLDMFTLGPLYPELSHAKEKQYYMPEMLRDVLEWKLQKLSKA